MSKEQLFKTYEFGEVVSISKEKFDPRLNKISLPCIELEHISKEDGRLHGITESRLQNSIKNKFVAGDVLFGKLRPYLKKYYLPDFDGVCSSEIWVFKNNKKICESRYLFYLVQSHRFIKAASATCGTKMPRADWSWVSEFPISLPPLSEQKKIAEVLSRWDKAIEKTTCLIESKKNLKQGLMQQLLTGKKRFKEFKNLNWKKMELQEFLAPVTRAISKPDTEYTALGIRSHGKGTFLKKIENHKDIMMDTLYEVRKDDLIVNITFAWEGAIAIVKKTDEGALVSHRFPTYVFDRTKVTPDFFRHIILTKRFVHQLGLISPGGAGRNRVLSKSDFLTLCVSIPPLEEQTKNAGILDALDREINTLEIMLKTIQNQKTGLMQKLLTGQIRVKA